MDVIQIYYMKIVEILFFSLKEVTFLNLIYVRIEQFLLLSIMILKAFIFILFSWKQLNSCLSEYHWYWFMNLINLILGKLYHTCWW